MESIPRNTILVGKAEEILPSLPVGSIPLFIFSPPYNLANRSARSGTFGITRIGTGWRRELCKNTLYASPRVDLYFRKTRVSLARQISVSRWGCLDYRAGIFNVAPRPVPSSAGAADLGDHRDTH